MRRCTCAVISDGWDARHSHESENALGTSTSLVLETLRKNSMLFHAICAPDAGQLVRQLVGMLSFQNSV
tara:strand:+ start:533 stop:739 length:207 start_codon:yes stop_codon:yes gene_type:complete